MGTKILCGDSAEMLRTLPDGCANTCVTSPPYFGLRDYGRGGQIGLEETPERYIERLTEVFREVWRVLRDDGTLWVNIGDSYAGSGKGGATDAENAKQYKQGTNKGTLAVATASIPKTFEGIKRKDLIGVPWMLAFALRSEGWYLRQDIIWEKPNPMTESVTDRCTKCHEYIFLLSKKPKYYFDHSAMLELANPKYESRYKSAFNTGKVQSPGYRPGLQNNTEGMKKYTGTRNKRSVWRVACNSSYHGAHFATYPIKLIEPCILAGCPEGGTVLDPFLGSGTTAICAELNGRNCIGIDLNPDYVKLAEKRIEDETKNGKELKITF